ncbi:hypothetical protein D3C80_1981010 [compost metagenome]
MRNNVAIAVRLPLFSPVAPRMGDVERTWLDRYWVRLLTGLVYTSGKLSLINKSRFRAVSRSIW